MDTTYKTKETILEKVAVLSLQSKKVKLTYDKVIAESGRIERVAESYFINSKESDYNKFVLRWIKENLNKLLYTNELSYDIIIPDEAYENDIEKYFSN